VRSLSRRQVAHHSPWACVTTLRSWSVPRRHPCRTFARRCQPAPGRSDRLRFLDGGGQGCRGCVSIASQAAQTSAEVDDQQVQGGLPRLVLPLDAPLRRPQGPGPGRSPTPGPRSGPMRPVRHRWSAHRDRSSAHPAAVMTSQVTLEASIPRMASAGSIGVLMVLDPRLEFGVVSGGIPLGDLDPAPSGEPLTLTRGTRRPSTALAQGDGLGIRCLRKCHSCSKCVVMSRAHSSSR